MKGSIIGFANERTDPISGYFHNGNGYRTYNPVLERFNYPDHWSPFGSGGINTYAYCAGDPVNRVDPSGHKSFLSFLGVGVGVALGVLLTPVSGGSSLALALSVLSVFTAVASTGLAVAQQCLQESNPKAAAALGWAALATGIASGLSTAVLYRVAAGAKSLAGLLKGTSNRPFGGQMMEGVDVPGDATTMVELPKRTSPYVLPEEFRDFQKQYEREAVKIAAKKNLPLTKRYFAGANTIVTLGRHLRSVRSDSGIILPAYSRDLQLIYPLRPDYQLMLHEAYTALNIPPSRFDFRFFQEVLPPYSSEDRIAGEIYAEHMRPPPAYHEHEDDPSEYEITHL